METIKRQIKLCTAGWS